MEYWRLQKKLQAQSDKHDFFQQAQKRFKTTAINFFWNPVKRAHQFVVLFVCRSKCEVAYLYVAVSVKWLICLRALSAIWLLLLEATFFSISDRNYKQNIWF